MRCANDDIVKSLVCMYVSLEYVRVLPPCVCFLSLPVRTKQNNFFHTTIDGLHIIYLFFSFLISTQKYQIRPADVELCFVDTRV